MNKNLKNIETILIAFFITMVLISSSSISVTLNTTQYHKNINSKINEKELDIKRSLTGLAPKNNNKKTVLKTAVDDKNEPDVMISGNTKPLGETMWGYNAYSSGGLSEGPVYFDIDDPGNTVVLLAATMSGDFMSGGTWMPDERWICCEYASGILWEIDPEEGDMTSIGGGGQALNGLGWDPVNAQMYGIGNTDDLFKVDYETGQTELVGSGGTGQTMIALLFDRDGNAYSYDVKFSGNSIWYSVDLTTGALTQIGDMGKTMCYAQDGDYCCILDKMFLTGYIYSPEYGGYLCEVDISSGEITDWVQFQYNCEIDASMFQNYIWFPHHDVGINSINLPEESCYAVPDIPMQVTVKNYGIYNEITDVNMQVIKYEENSVIFEEDFSGTFPPEGWTTDWWNQSYTNVAGGESPEARCYKYDQYNGSYDYYDNYIQSPPINCTDLEKINLMFRWASDVYYDNYCSFYIKYRKNSTSPWKDVTPWTNPIAQDQTADLYEIGCYGFGESLGDEFQFKFEYLGYYYYFNYWWLDNVTINSYNYSLEYNETIKDVEISIGNQVIVDFPNWTPSDWQNPDYENLWQDYQVIACTLLDNDIKPKNNCKQKIIEVYFPSMNDIEITSIDSPSEDGSGKIYPVQATIKNVGQYPECCIPINISIGEQVVLDEILNEESWETVPPDGWTDEHKNYTSYYGWDKSNTSYSGGSSPEARLPYYYALSDYHFYSYALDMTNYPAGKLKFKSYINHYSGQGFYTLNAGYSHDGVNWYTTWSVAPSENTLYDIEVDIVGGSPTVFIGFWCIDDPYYFNYWYIDDVIVKAVDILEDEYSDHMCQGPDLQPGETRQFEFNDWTPQALLDEETCTNDYLIQAEIAMEGDKNPGNNVKSGKFTLDFWHDAAVTVANPASGSNPEEWLGFDDGTAVNALGTCGPFEYAIRLTPDELADYAGYTIQSVKRHHSWITPFTMSGKVKIYEQGTPTNPGDLITEQPFTCYEAYWHEVLLDEHVPITGNKDIWVSIEVDCHSGQYPAAMDASNNYPTKGDWITLGSSWHEASIYGFYTDWLIRAGVGAGTGVQINAYIQPGTQNIEGLAKNKGTFPELNLTCYAEIYDYIDDPENGTLLYEDNITDIDLDTPLEGTELLNFDNYNFLKEGRYGLFLNLPDDNDDSPNNNYIAWGIGVDETNPVSTHALYPATPDGKNGWYVSDIEVTLIAYDPFGHRVASGVREIKYIIDGGPIQTITGDHGTFVVYNDKDNISIEYWAIDNVGNEESHHTFTIDMDQTDPLVDLTYEWTEGPKPDSWWMIFTASASDATSGMDRVEFYLNDLLQDTVTGPGPTYSWKFLYSGGLHITIKAEGYDVAGNMKFDEIVNPENIDSNQLQSKNYILLTHPLIQ